MVWIILTVVAMLVMTVRTIADPTASTFWPNLKDFFDKNSSLMDRLLSIVQIFTCFGVAVVLFVVSFSMAIVTTNDRSEYSLQLPLSGDAHLSDLETSEWTQYKPSVGSMTQCDGLGRAANIYSGACGFCKSGFSSTFHGPGMTRCSSNVLVDMSHCTSLNRTDGQIGVFCGSCTSGYWGAPNPSVMPCKECILCPDGLLRLNCGTSRGSCVQKCPSNYRKNALECVADLVSPVTCTNDLEQSRRSKSSCVELPALPLGGSSVVLGMWSRKEHDFVTSSSLWADHFAIRPANGARNRMFHSDVFDYQWDVLSNVNPDGFQKVWNPFEIAVPVRFSGKMRSAWPDHSSLASVLVQIPRGNEPFYRDEDSWLLTNRNIYNRMFGSIFPLPTETTNAPLLNTDKDTDPDEALQWMLWPVFNVTARAGILSKGRTSLLGLKDEGLMTPLSLTGDWVLTAMVQLPKDPATSGCPVLPVRITVTAADGYTRRIYSVAVAGSDRSSCSRSAAEKNFHRIAETFFTSSE